MLLELLGPNSFAPPGLCLFYYASIPRAYALGYLLAPLTGLNTVAHFL